MSRKLEIDNRVVQDMIARGSTIKQIADTCNVSATTMKKYFKDLSLKTQTMLQRESSICLKHNIEFAQRTDGKRVCMKCNSDGVTEHRKRLKVKAVEYLGGKCERCGYDKSIAALDFHHKDPTEKDFGISDEGITRSWEVIQHELDKCMLVCANCHREIHEELNLEN